MSECKRERERERERWAHKKQLVTNVHCLRSDKGIMAACGSLTLSLSLFLSRSLSLFLYVCLPLSLSLCLSLTLSPLLSLSLETSFFILLRNRHLLSSLKRERGSKLKTFKRIELRGSNGKFKRVKLEAKIEGMKPSPGPLGTLPP